MILAAETTVQETPHYDMTVGRTKGETDHHTTSRPENLFLSNLLTPQSFGSHRSTCAPKDHEILEDTETTDCLSGDHYSRDFFSVTNFPSASDLFGAESVGSSRARAIDAWRLSNAKERAKYQACNAFQENKMAGSLKKHPRKHSCNATQLDAQRYRKQARKPSNCLGGQNWGSDNLGGCCIPSYIHVGKRHSRSDDGGRCGGLETSFDRRLEWISIWVHKWKEEDRYVDFNCIDEEGDIEDTLANGQVQLLLNTDCSSLAPEAALELLKASDRQQALRKAIKRRTRHTYEFMMRGGCAALKKLTQSESTCNTLSSMLDSFSNNTESSTRSDAVWDYDKEDPFCLRRKQPKRKFDPYLSRICRDEFGEVRPTPSTFRRVVRGITSQRLEQYDVLNTTTAAEPGMTPSFEATDGAVLVQTLQARSGCVCRKGCRRLDATMLKTYGRYWFYWVRATPEGVSARVKNLAVTIPLNTIYGSAATREVDALRIALKVLPPPHRAIFILSDAAAVVSLQNAGASTPYMHSMIREVYELVPYCRPWFLYVPAERMKAGASDERIGDEVIFFNVDDT